MKNNSKQKNKITMEGGLGWTDKERKDAEKIAKALINNLNKGIKEHAEAAKKSFEERAKKLGITVDELKKRIEKLRNS